MVVALGTNDISLDDTWISFHKEARICLGLSVVIAVIAGAVACGFVDYYLALALGISVLCSALCSYFLGE